MDALVIAAEVRPSGVGKEPMTVAVLRADDGTERTVAVLGGPTAGGGFSRPAGMVVPVLGARVRWDLAEERASAPALAWAKGGAQWASGSLPVAFALSAAGSRDVGLDAGAELDVATRAWSTVACTSFRATYAGTSAAPAGDDGVNVVYFHDDVWPAMLTPKGLAQTMLHSNANGELHDADIHVNGVDYKWSLQGSGATPDVRAILTHELGHAIGLAHSTVQGATMFATYPGGLGWRSLETDDRDGVCALYPGQGAQGCDANPCPTGFVCVANACERKGAQGVVCAPCDRKPGACAGAGDDARCIDLGNPARGQVCARACATSAECGKGFQCLPTTTSGDLQCVSDDGCASGPNACATDKDCVAGTCTMGACLGPVTPADAGADGSADGGAAAAPVKAGCSCDTSGSAQGAGGFALAALAVAIGLRRKRRA